MLQLSSIGDANVVSLRDPAMPAPLPGRRIELSDKRAGRIAFYGETRASSGGTALPLVLVHSVNAAATAYEMKTLFEHYRGKRPVYALDLPGFGLSDRSDRKYTPRLMTDAIHAAVREIQSTHGDAAIDIIALSLGCEFAARAATETPKAFRSVALISPTGFDRRSARAAQNVRADGTRAIPWLHGLLSIPLWKRGFFSALTSRASIRFFLQKTWGARNIDEGLLEYDYITTHQPGAENAPYYFVSGYLFSTDAMKLYQSLSMPVWMSHGVRGDFVDYERKDNVLRLPNWTVSVFQTGAMPHFEIPTKFIALYETFLNRITEQ
jgi:pimeloyl-ACP methyl ester carboxylesterase